MTQEILGILKQPDSVTLWLGSKGRDKLESEKNKEFDYSMFDYGKDSNTTLDSTFLVSFSNLVILYCEH